MAFRPRISDDHARALQAAAALAGLTPAKYCELVLRPMVEADLRSRTQSVPALRGVVPTEEQTDA